jgi:Zn-dependent M28 family amino/carboxypeptidase
MNLKKVRNGTLLYLLVILYSCSTIFKSDDKKTDPIETIISEVKIDSLVHTINILSGEIPSSCNDQDRILSRHMNYDGNEAAEHYIENTLSGYDLQVTKQERGNTLGNVIAVQIGSVFPEIIFIIGAHYDSKPVSSRAPGADDNASGVAAVIEAARILSQYDTRYTIDYALWDEEEVGLIGSRYHAEIANENQQLVQAVINLDMIGWDSDNDHVTVLHEDENVGSILMVRRAVELIEKWELDIVPVITQRRYASDHIAFREYGVAATCITEDFIDDFNENWHTTEDRTDNLNLEYYRENAKLSVALMASFAEVSKRKD